MVLWQLTSRWLFMTYSPLAHSFSHVVLQWICMCHQYKMAKMMVCRFWIRLQETLKLPFCVLSLPLLLSPSFPLFLFLPPSLSLWKKLGAMLCYEGSHVVRNQDLFQQTMYVSLWVDPPALGKSSDDCSPAYHLDYNAMRSPELEPPN